LTKSSAGWPPRKDAAVQVVKILSTPHATG
jgi:hypothetical protein